MIADPGAPLRRTTCFVKFRTIDVCQFIIIGEWLHALGSFRTLSRV
jgi:hypothetical protein